MQNTNTSTHSSDNDQMLDTFEFDIDDAKNEVELFAIDMSQSDKQNIVKQLMKQMSTVGFCLVTNVPGHDENELLKASRAFHELPQDVKMRLAPKHFNPENENIYHGYFPFLQNDPSLKEFYDMARPFKDISDFERKGCKLYEENPWLTQEMLDKYGLKLEDYQWIKDKFEHQYSIFHTLALQLISCLAVGLGKRPDYFEPWFKDECLSNLRPIHYKPRIEAEHQNMSKDDFKLTTPEHADSGFITILTTFMYPGLQVEINGEYRSIKPKENAIIINIGETLERISNYQIKATRHRVLDIGIERYSAPFFLIPKCSARITPELLQTQRKFCEDDLYDIDPKNEEEVQKLQPFGDILVDKMTNAFGEWKGFQTSKMSFDYSGKYQLIKQKIQESQNQ